MHLRIINHQAKGTQDAHSREFWIVILGVEAAMCSKSLKAWQCWCCCCCYCCCCCWWWTSSSSSSSSSFIVYLKTNLVDQIWSACCRKFVNVLEKIAKKGEMSSFVVLSHRLSGAAEEHHGNYRQGSRYQSPHLQVRSVTDFSVYHSISVGANKTLPVLYLKYYIYNVLITSSI